MKPFIYANSWVLLFLFLLFGAVLAQEFSCDEGSEEREENPIGTCACDGHLWVSQGCKEGYFCIEREGRGCYKVGFKLVLSVSFVSDVVTTSITYTEPVPAIQTYCRY